MKKKQLFTLALICSLVAFIMSSCSGGAMYYIDNPTNKEITVTIDGKSTKLTPNEFKKMDGSLKLGKHTMKVDDGNEIAFDIDKNHVILNPTLSTYIIVLQEYGTGIASDDDYTTITLDGEEYEGPFPIVTSDPFIYSGDLNLLIDKTFKEEIYTSKSGTVTMRKIFRKSDFIKFYEEEYN